MKAVLFDLDGTLLDTLPDIAFTLNETLKSFGYPECTLAQVRRYVGNGAEKLVRRALPKDAPWEDVYAAFRARYGASGHERTAPFEGIEDLLHQLKNRGVKLAVVTNKPQEATVPSVEKFFSGVFDVVQGDSGMFPCKPDPSLARYCALTMRVPVCDCVFVGDGETDVRTAQRAGMRHVCALWGYRSRTVLERAGGTTFAGTPKELEKILLNF